MTTTLTPNLMTEDVNKSINFYCERLGFRFLAGYPEEDNRMREVYSPNTPLQWAMLGRDGAMLMFQSRNSIGDDYAPLGDLPLGASAALYIEVENLGSLLAGLGDGVKTVVAERTTFYGMREVWIEDNNGYILVLAQKAQDNSA
jgi:uncharacterized glyoxalase superfamily protein PhnB